MILVHNWMNQSRGQCIGRQQLSFNVDRLFIYLGGQFERLCNISYICFLRDQSDQIKDFTIVHIHNIIINTTFKLVSRFPLPSMDTAALNAEYQVSFS